MYLVLVHSSWLTEPKTLGSSYDESDKGVFCYVNKVTFGPNFKDGNWLPRDSTSNFQSHPLTSREGRGAGD